MTVPASAGPMMRELWTTTEFSATALTTRSEPTISTTKDWRDGLSIASTPPRTSTSASTIHGWAAPEAASANSVSAGIISESCV